MLIGIGHQSGEIKRNELQAAERSEILQRETAEPCVALELCLGQPAARE